MSPKTLSRVPVGLASDQRDGTVRGALEFCCSNWIENKGMGLGGPILDCEALDL